MIRGGLFEEEEEDIVAKEVLAPTSFHRTLSAPLQKRFSSSSGR